MNKFFVHVFFLIFSSEFSSKNLGNLWWKDSVQKKNQNCSILFWKSAFDYSSTKIISTFLSCLKCTQRFNNLPIASAFSATRGCLWSFACWKTSCSSKWCEHCSVRASIEVNPETSSRRRSQQLVMSRRSLQRILHNLHLYLYKFNWFMS